MKEKVEMASKINCMQEFKRCFSIIAILVFFVISVFSQQLQVESCLIAESDISAQIQYRKDLNEKNCALVKVGLGLQNAQFEHFEGGYHRGEDGQKRKKVVGVLFE